MRYFLAFIRNLHATLSAPGRKPPSCKMKASDASKAPAFITIRNSAPLFAPVSPFTRQVLLGTRCDLRFTKRLSLFTRYFPAFIRKLHATLSAPGRKPPSCKYESFGHFRSSPLPHYSQLNSAIRTGTPVYEAGFARYEVRSAFYEEVFARYEVLFLKYEKPPFSTDSLRRRFPTKNSPLHAKGAVAIDYSAAVSTMRPSTS